MALSGSDPFTTLPAELRLRVIMLTNHTTTILRLIRASPSMLQQYHTDKIYIRRYIIDYDEDMTQDAMAIILIPRLCRTSKEVPDENTVMRARAVLQDWSIGQLPHPIQHRSDHVTSQLNELHNRILFFAEDYITKATASFPPRDYRCLPQMQQPLANGYIMFKGVKVAPRFNFLYLTASEKKRIFKAFLRHELMCRASTLFPKEYGLPTRLISRAESEGINCVRDYYCSVYGAIFAQCSDAQLLSSPEGMPLETELIFPDTFHFDANHYAHKLDLFDENWWEEFPDFAFWFSRLGLDRLADFLRYDMAKEDVREALKLQIQYTWFGGGQKHSLGWDWPLSSIFEQLKLSDDTGDHSPIFKHLDGSFKRTIQWDIARQRAWVFFDDTRFYPRETSERPNFPSTNLLMEKCIQQTFNDKWFYHSYAMRNMRRVKLAREERVKAGIPEVDWRRACPVLVSGLSSSGS